MSRLPGFCTRARSGKTHVDSASALLLVSHVISTYCNMHVRIFGKLITIQIKILSRTKR